MSPIKMPLIFVVVVALSSFTLVASFPGPPNCSRGKVWNNCMFQNPGTCDEEFRPSVRMCFQGCDCAVGSLLLNNHSRICVPKEECPKECRKQPHVVFSRCKPKCVEICDEETGLRERKCQDNGACVPGCTCRTGYGLNVSGTCTRFTKSVCYGGNKSSKESSGAARVQMSMSVNSEN